MAVELAPVRDPEFVDHAVVEALGPTDHTARGTRGTLLAYLADRQLLLVLDGFEHLVDACASLVSELLRRAPGLWVLAAGRRALDVAGERVVPLGPLGEEEATDLFMDRAARHGIALRDDPEVRELCRRLDCIPLAVELAAGRMTFFFPRAGP